MDELPSARIFDLIDRGDAEGLAQLLKADPRAAAARDASGISALIRAAYRSDALARLILDAAPPLSDWDRLFANQADGLPPPDAWSPDGFTPLHLAVYARNLAAVRALLAAGADPNTVARASFARVTPLGTAAFVGDLEIARALLDHGADPTLPGPETNPLATARAAGNHALVALLEQRRA